MWWQQILPAITQRPSKVEKNAKFKKKMGRRKIKKCRDRLVKKYSDKVGRDAWGLLKK